MKLSTAQIAALKTATKDRDWCLRVNGMLRKALLDKGLIKNTSGFGWKFGGIQELTSSGHIALEEILKAERHKK